jgi:hypothetical protein
MVDPAAVRAIAEELYGLRPEEFTPARTAAEKQARAAGDKELAAAVKGLRRPAVAAWAVNLLVRERGELVEQVVSLGDSLRQAQSLLQGDALRDLARQRRQLIAAVTTEVRTLARAEGQKLSDAATRQVEDTLQAAMTDRSAAEAVLSGLLAQPLSSTGLESLAEVLAVPLDREPSPATTRRPALSVVRDEGRARREAEERVEAAGTAVRSASQAHDETVARQAEARARVLQLEAGVEELRRQLAEAEQEAEEAADRLTEVDAEVEESEAELTEARAQAEAAAEALAQVAKG